MDNTRGFDMDLLMRWFQFSAFCGIFRVHGYRAPEMDTGVCSSDTSYASGLGLSPTSAHNEVYTFTAADHVFNYSASIIKVVKLRESMRSYVAKLFAAYANSGEPIMRSMFYDFPMDPNCTTDAISDQYMFGPSVLVAPIYTNCSANFSCTERNVYLPALPKGEVWMHVFTNATVSGSQTGQHISVSGERDTFPLFTRGVVPGVIFRGEHSPLPEFHARLQPVTQVQ
jgi:alpha-D-xyloside xylohydrolase